MNFHEFWKFIFGFEKNFSKYEFELVRQEKFNVIIAWTVIIGLITGQISIILITSRSWFFSYLVIFLKITFNRSEFLSTRQLLKNNSLAWCNKNSNSCSSSLKFGTFISTLTSFNFENEINSYVKLIVVNWSILRMHQMANCQLLQWCWWQLKNVGDEIIMSVNKLQQIGHQHLLSVIFVIMTWSLTCNRHISSPKSMKQSETDRIQRRW